MAFCALTYKFFPDAFASAELDLTNTGTSSLELSLLQRNQLTEPVCRKGMTWCRWQCPIPSASVLIYIQEPCAERARENEAELNGKDVWVEDAGPSRHPCP